MEPGTVVLFTLGGTISMAGRAPSGGAGSAGDGGGGVVVRLGGGDLVAAAGDAGVPVEVRDLRAVPSADLSFATVLDAVAAAGEAVAGGAGGVVLSQGTDTLEETAFLVDLVWPHEVPFVVTGAMRNPTLPGADGPANVAGAVRVAAADTARGRGALVVLADEIHAARRVRKAHSVSTAAFASPDSGPVGHIVEGVPRFHTGPDRMPRPASLAAYPGTDPSAVRVALYTVTCDDDGVLLRGLLATHDGLVVAGFGVGHVPGALAPVLGELTARMPVVLASRTGAGPVLADTYGSVGSERDLRERGLIGAGFLHPYKARVLLRLLLAAGADRADIAAAFAALGE